MTVADAPVQPVLLGGDFGVYALARSFHEAYGATSIVLSHAPTVSIVLPCRADHCACFR